MPLKLIPPRKGKSPNWTVRGTYLSIAVDRSTGAAEERVAKIVRRRWKEEIERGEYRDPRAPSPVATPAEPTFLAAAVSYMKAGGERKYLSAIIEMTVESSLRDRALASIDQIAIDAAADALYPRSTAATRNRQFYTPVSAVLKHAGIDRRFKRPKGWRGKKSTSWLEPHQAFAAFAAADEIDCEFGIFLRTLLYTGMRLGEALAVQLRHISLAEAAIYLPETKNGEARTVYLPESLIASLEGHPRGLCRPPGERLWRFHASGRLREMLKQTWAKAGIALPRRQGGFHVFCHTYGTWMHRYGGLDTFGLVRTERWKDPRSADRYRHTQVSEESRRASLLPIEGARGLDVANPAIKPKLLIRNT